MQAGAEMRKFYLVVKSTLVDLKDRDGFDEWYRTDHMPKALVQLGALAGRRYWSDTDPSVHYAVYRFADIDRPRQVKARSDGPGGVLTHEFDAAWPGVSRTREVLVAGD